MQWVMSKVAYRPEVLVSHRNARLNESGRQLLVERVCEQGWAVAHAAKAKASRGSAPTDGSTGSARKARPACRGCPRVRTTAHARPLLRSKKRS